MGYLRRCISLEALGPVLELGDEFILRSVDTGHPLRLQLGQLVVKPADVVDDDELVLLPRLVCLLPAVHGLAELLTPLMALRPDILDVVLALPGLRLEVQHQLVVRVRLRLLVEVRAGLHSAHDSLAHRRVVHADLHRAAGQRHHEREFVERHRPARLVHRHRYPADRLAVGRAPPSQPLQLVVLVVVYLVPGELCIGEVEGVVRVRHRGVLWGVLWELPTESLLAPLLVGAFPFFLFLCARPALGEAPLTDIY